MTGLGTVFKKVFGEGLKEAEFVKIKGRYPYLVRVVEGGEILNILTCRNEWCGEKGFKEFDICGTVATVYRNPGSLNLMKSVRAVENQRHYDDLAEVYYKMDPINCDAEYRKKLICFKYKQDDEQSLYDEMTRALEETKNIMFSMFDSVDSLEKCVYYFLRFQRMQYEYGLYFLTNNRDDFIKLRDEKIKESIVEHQRMISTLTEQDIFNRKEEWRIGEIERRDAIYNNPEEYAAIMKKMEENKKINIENLRSWGIEI